MTTLPPLPAATHARAEVRHRPGTYGENEMSRIAPMPTGTRPPSADAVVDHVAAFLRRLVKDHVQDEPGDWPGVASHIAESRLRVAVARSLLSTEWKEAQGALECIAKIEANRSRTSPDYDAVESQTMELAYAVEQYTADAISEVDQAIGYLREA